MDQVQQEKMGPRRGSWTGGTRGDVQGEQKGRFWSQRKGELISSVLYVCVCVKNGVITDEEMYDRWIRVTADQLWGQLVRHFFRMITTLDCPLDIVH